MKGRNLVVWVLIAAALGTGAFFLFRRSPSVPPATAPLQTEPRSSLPSRPADEIHAEWKDKVAAILSAYDQDHDAKVARDALLALTVTRADQEVDLELVLAFQALVDGKTKEGQSDLQQARVQFTKLP